MWLSSRKCTFLNMNLLDGMGRIRGHEKARAAGSRDEGGTSPWALLQFADEAEPQPLRQALEMTARAQNVL